MTKWTIFEISFLWKHQYLCFHYWDYLTNFWRNKWQSIIDVVEKLSLLFGPLEYFVMRRLFLFWHNYGQPLKSRSKLFLFWLFFRFARTILCVKNCSLSSQRKVWKKKLRPERHLLKKEYFSVTYLMKWIMKRLKMSSKAIAVLCCVVKCLKTEISATLGLQSLNLTQVRQRLMQFKSWTAISVMEGN